MLKDIKFYFWIVNYQYSGFFSTSFVVSIKSVDILSLCNVDTNRHPCETDLTEECSLLTGRLRASPVTVRILGFGNLYYQCFILTAARIVLGLSSETVSSWDNLLALFFFHDLLELFLLEEVVNYFNYELWVLSFCIWNTERPVCFLKRSECSSNMPSHQTRGFVTTRIRPHAAYSSFLCQAYFVYFLISVVLSLLVFLPNNLQASSLNSNGCKCLIVNPLRTSRGLAHARQALCYWNISSALPSY